MAIWQHDKTGARFDDGLAALPGEEGFTRDVATAHYGNSAFSYVSTPGWEPEADVAPDQVGILPAP